MVFYSGKKGKQVFFELETDEFFGAHVAEGSGAGGVVVIPGVGDGLGKEINPAAVGGGKGKGGAERGGSNVDGGFIELESIQLTYCRELLSAYIYENVAIAVFLLQKKGICRSDNV